MAKQQRLSNDEFLTRLSTLLNSTHSRHHGSVFLTQKRLVEQPTTKSTPDDLSDLSTPSQPLPVLVRATNGIRPARLKPKTSSGDTQKNTDNTPKIKLATVVQADDLEAFYEKYGEVCKAGMAQGLKKRDRRRNRDKKKKGKKGGAVEGEKKA